MTAEEYIKKRLVKFLDAKKKDGLYIIPENAVHDDQLDKLAFEIVEEIIYKGDMKGE